MASVRGQPLTDALPTLQPNFPALATRPGPGSPCPTGPDPTRPALCLPSFPHRRPCALSAAACVLWFHHFAARSCAWTSLTVIFSHSSNRASQQHSIFSTLIRGRSCGPVVSVFAGVYRPCRVWFCCGFFLLRVEMEMIPCVSSAPVSLWWKRFYEI